jgi:hypothetical protein
MPELLVMRVMAEQELLVFDECLLLLQIQNEILFFLQEGIPFVHLALLLFSQMKQELQLKVKPELILLPLYQDLKPELILLPLYQDLQVV